MTERRIDLVTASALAPPRIFEPLLPDADQIVSANFDPQRIEAVIAIPTFRRPEMLRATLDSLVAQQTQVSFAVVVVDNDAANRAGLPVAAQFLAGKLRGLATIEPNQGNCHAINRAFGLARAYFPQAQYFLMIDDDEIAAPNWLQTMIDAAKFSGADIVGGPVFPKFGQDAPPRVHHHPVFLPAYDKSGKIPMIYGSGNCLIHRRVFAALTNPDFDLRYNFLGGGDTDFFTRCKLAGLKAYWAQKAEISEIVPPNRTRIDWILKRGLRIGAVNFELDKRYTQNAFGALAPYVKNLVLIPVSLWRGALALFKTGNWLIASHPIMVATGRILASFRIETQQYRANSAHKSPK